MGWLDKVLDAVQKAAVIGDRVERLGLAVAELAKDLRDLDRRLSRLEGQVAARVAVARTPPSAELPALPGPQPDAPANLLPPDRTTDR
jgi:hypothetical protein